MLERKILNLIKANSAIPIDHFMELALSSETNSYYRDKNPFDGMGDFITSPEISQMFGEMVGIWLYKQWKNIGEGHVSLVELGPGRGFLMRDIISVLSKTDMKNKFNIVLLEINSTLKQEQKKNIKFNNIKWVDDISKIPNSKCLFIANEFFDALPIKQFVKEKTIWKEITINSNENNDMLFFDRKVILDDFNDYLNNEYPNALDGAIIEESLTSIEKVKKISENIINYDSSAIIIDYAYDINPLNRKSTQFYSTLQAIREHKYVPVLEKIGSSDLTAHVDFASLKKSAHQRGISCYGSITQKDFLYNLGIEIRAKELISKNQKLESVIKNQLDRLTSSDKMGELFKVLFLTSKNNKCFLF